MYTYSMGVSSIMGTLGLLQIIINFVLEIIS